MHNYLDLITLFNACFQQSHQTILVKGEAEPLYLPATIENPWHQVIFAHGFFASALHECAHWCIAGEKRRLQIDYGYWYEPDGRNEIQQQLFQQVEVKPQALECLFAKASNHSFRCSNDNLNGAMADTKSFEEAVRAQVMHYEDNGLPARAAIFYDALTDFYKTT